MTEEEIERWMHDAKHIDSGSYNKARVSRSSFTIDGYTSYWVERTPIHPNDPLSNTTRAIRKWRLINPQYPVYKTRRGTLTPYFGPLTFIHSENPVKFFYSSDARRSQKVIDIYQKTKNLVYDIAVKTNVLLYKNHLTDEYEDVVVDLDLALETGSIATDEYYQDYVEEDFLMRCQKSGFPKTTAMIQTIRYIESQLPPDKIQFQRITHPLCKRLEYFFVYQLTVTEKIFNFLLDWQDADPLNEYEIETFPIKLLHQESFFPATSPLTKEQLAEIMVSYILENIRQEKENTVIRYLKIAFAVTPSLKDRLNKEGHTLLHLAVIHAYDELVFFMFKYQPNINIKTPTQTHYRKFCCAGMTAFDIAIIRKAPEKVIRLFRSRSSWYDSLRNILSTDHWYLEHELINIYDSIYMMLLSFCNDDIATLWDNEHIHIWNTIIRYPEVLTWPIDPEGYTALHHIFRKADRAVISYLTTKEYWPILEQTKNLRNQHTLFDFIAKNGQLSERVLHYARPSNPRDKMRALRAAVRASQLDFTKRLLDMGFDPNDVAPHEASLFFHAGQRNKQLMCELLLSYGTHPMTYRIRPDVPQEWPAHIENNPIRKFAMKLANLAKGVLKETEAGKKSLITYLKKYPWFLSWPLSESGSTFLHYCFRSNQTDIISQLITHPQWPKLAKTINPKTKISLFDEIIIKEQLDYYELLKPCIDDRQAHDKALNYAVRTGMVQSCLRLISDGANPEILISWEKIPCYEYWAKNYPEKENPFTEYLHQKIWQQQKSEVLEQLEHICSSYGLSTYHFFSFNKEIKNYFALIKNQIMNIEFNIQTQLEEEIAKLVDEALKNIPETLNHAFIQSILNRIKTALNHPESIMTDIIEQTNPYETLAYR